MIADVSQVVKQFPDADVVHAVWEDPNNATGFGMLVVRGIGHLIQLERVQEAKSLRCAVVSVSDVGAAITLALQEIES